MSVRGASRLGACTRPIARQRPMLQCVLQLLMSITSDVVTFSDLLVQHCLVQHCLMVRNYAFTTVLWDPGARLVRPFESRPCCHTCRGSSRRGACPIAHQRADVKGPQASYPVEGFLGTFLLCHMQQLLQPCGHLYIQPTCSCTFSRTYNRTHCAGSRVPHGCSHPHHVGVSIPGAHAGPRAPQHVSVREPRRLHGRRAEDVGELEVSVDNVVQITAGVVVRVVAG